MGKQKAAKAKLSEVPEVREVPSLTIVFDYRYDGPGFFEANPEARARLEAASEGVRDGLDSGLNAITPRTSDLSVLPGSIVVYSGSRQLGDDKAALEMASLHLARAIVSAEIQRLVGETKGVEGLNGKQQLAKTINAVCRRNGIAIAHPESGDPCTLFALDDRKTGRFLLENRVTKTRSHSTPDINTLLPFTLIRIPEDGLYVG